MIMLCNLRILILSYKPVPYSSVFKLKDLKRYIPVNLLHFSFFFLMMCILVLLFIFFFVNRDLPPAERLKYGIKDNLVRFSFGVEDFDDLKADIVQALDQI
jgi:Cys/Met metabolism PLP-dependent enzyme